MPLPTSARALKKPRLDDEVRFLRSWIEKPLHMGAVMPSSKLLARTMAEYVAVESDGPVVELGPGTGAITNALIEHGVDQKRLVLVEYNPGFCALLRDRYTQAKVVQGDAYALRTSLDNVLDSPASAVVSGLPLVTKPMLTRLKLIRDAFVALGGFAPLPLMEDLDLVRRLRRRGRVAALRRTVVTSARRWQRHGVWRTVLLMWTLRLGFYAGVPPATLARWYRDAR